MFANYTDVLYIVNAKSLFDDTNLSGLNGESNFQMTIVAITYTWLDMYEPET